MLSKHQQYHRPKINKTVAQPPIKLPPLHHHNHRHHCLQQNHTPKKPTNQIDKRHHLAINIIERHWLCAIALTSNPKTKTLGDFNRLYFNYLWLLLKLSSSSSSSLIVFAWPCIFPSSTSMPWSKAQW